MRSWSGAIPATRVLTAHPITLNGFDFGTGSTGIAPDRPCQPIEEFDPGSAWLRHVADIAWFNSQWVPDASMLTDPRVSPLYVPDLDGLPAAIVITCEHDPLRDQGEAYAERLRAAGVPTTMRRELDMVRNFLLWDTVSPACAAAADRAAADLAAALRRAER